MNFGKVSIKKFLYNLPIGNCLICPSIGEDAGVVELKDKYLIIHSDPITETRDDSGFLSIAVACNDVNMKGAECKWVVTTILLSDISHLDNIISGINEACNIIGCKVIGGHTEVTNSVKQDIVVTTAFSASDKFLDYSNIKEGMKVILIGSPGIEGTWILAKDYEELLLNKGVKKEIIEISKRKFKYDIIVQDRALRVSKFAIAMHDATEGGIMQALLEVAKASGYTVSVDLENIKLREETRVITKALNIDPFKLISSGAFIVVTDKVNEVLSNVDEAYVIGKIEKGDPVLNVKGVGVFNEDFEEELVRFESSYNGGR
ncbi:MAG: AIR synthase family protein [Saccharolobus sp.]